MPKGWDPSLVGWLRLLEHEVQRPRCCCWQQLVVRDGGNGTCVPRPLPPPLFSALAILSHKTALQGQMPPSAAREYPVDALAPALSWTKQSGNPLCLQPRPCPWPLGVAHGARKRRESLSPRPLPAAAALRHGVGSQHPAQLAEAIQFPLFLGRWGDNKGPAEIQPCCKLCKWQLRGLGERRARGMAEPPAAAVPGLVAQLEVASLHIAGSRRLEVFVCRAVSSEGGSQLRCLWMLPRSPGALCCLLCLLPAAFRCLGRLP